MTTRVLAATRAGNGVPRLASAGKIVGLFGKGYYVRMSNGPFAVGGPGLPAGPLHLVLAEPPPLPPPNSSVWLESGRLETATCIIDLSRARPYDPTLPQPERLDAVANALSRLDQRARVPADLASIWSAVRSAPDLGTARLLLEGRGSGLTPTGDDVLAALLLFARWTSPGSSEPSEVARRARTTELSRSFLYWAARGQSIEPVHKLTAAAGDLSPASALERLDDAIAGVAGIGGSSGLAMLAGFGLAATAWRMRTRR